MWQGPSIWNSGQKGLKLHFLGIRPLIIVVSVGQMFPCIICCGLPCSLVAKYEYLEGKYCLHMQDRSGLIK